MAIDPPYRLDPFRNIVNVRWGGQHYRYKVYIDVYANMNWSELRWVTDHWEGTYSGQWIAHITHSGSWGNPGDTYSEGCGFATDDLNSLYSSASHSWRLQGTPTFGGTDDQGTFKVSWEVWMWMGYSDWLSPGDPGYIPEDQFTTAPDAHYGPIYYGDFVSGKWGSPT